MTDIIIIIILVLAVGAACLYIWKQRKKGIKCIGCPYAKNGPCGGSCGSTQTKDKQ